MASHLCVFRDVQVVVHMPALLVKQIVLKFSTLLPHKLPTENQGSHVLTLGAAVFKFPGQIFIPFIFIIISLLS